MKVVRSSELPWSAALQKGAYFNRRKELGGGKLLSCGLWELPPGKKSFPLHAHHVTEEALFVVSGRAKVRTPDGETQIGSGDFVSFPPGGPAHQLINDGAEPLVYVAMSSNPAGADVVDYPETGKMGVMIKSPPGKRAMFREADQVEYFAGDKDAE